MTRILLRTASIGLAIGVLSFPLGFIAAALGDDPLTVGFPVFLVGTAIAITACAIVAVWQIWKL